ncbi:hypothetical protein QBC35DRAFT_53233 [Podospora australis]|uniref:Uncharacterized protein n=1 Tax=Podospora australis TaxID=1536484 RepID=A0AAN6WQB9_9PEZI|nr:hypothetical protein QBC35DRAFT_53233 [Podospora australis]
MASNNLPAGAFLTTIEGRRCTAVPRVGAVSVPPAGSSSEVQPTPAPTTIIQTPPAAVPEPTATPTTAAAVVVVGNQDIQDNQDANARGSTTSSIDTLADSLETLVPEASETPVLPDGAVATPLSTTIGSPPQGTVDGGAAAYTGATATATNTAVGAASASNSNAVQSTLAVAGGVIGGVVAISIFAFLFWWWRRRTFQKRRSTLLTPLDAPSFDKDEKGGYIIKRGSIGPTPVSEKVKAALGMNLRKIRGHLRNKTGGTSAPSVNMNRGTSQFIDAASTHSRANSGYNDNNNNNNNQGQITTKDRFVDWWSRLTADINFNWRLRNKSTGPDTLTAMSNNVPERKPGSVGSQPDFLTLLGMDDNELDREAQRRRGSLSRKNGSAGSAEHFLSGLNLSFGNGNGAGGDNPFSDANAIAHTSAQPAPLQSSGGLNVNSGNPNPFSDANAIRDQPQLPKPTTYVAEIRRSRGQSVATRQPSTIYNRDSLGSVSSFNNNRNKFRSDPFDLERPELLLASSGLPGSGSRNTAKNSIISSTAGTTGGSTMGDSIRKPEGARTRTESFSSKYSSGISLGDWSDPGPDVGPAAAARWVGPEKRESPTQGWRDRLEKEAAAATAGSSSKTSSPGRRQSGGSQASVGVGKAM